MTDKEKLTLHIENAETSKFDLKNAQLQDINYPLIRVLTDDWDRAKFRGINLSKANLPNANLYRAIIPEADFNGANLEAANLSEADLFNA